MYAGLGQTGAPLPQKWGVLYAHPNPDGTRKRCLNCVLWTEAGGGRCVIHRSNLRVTPTMVCGYHIYGMPLPHWVDLPGIQPVDERNSGLEEVGEGTSCDTCVLYEAQSQAKGLCHGVAKKNGLPPQPVEAMGCCARWDGGN
jgi:hypothetical protein